MRAVVMVLCILAMIVSLFSELLIALSEGHESLLNTELFVLMTTGNSTSRGDPAGGGPEWDDVIIEAIKTGNLAQLKGLMDKGSGPNARQKGGASALRWAAIYGHREIVISLLDHGAGIGMEQGGAQEEELIRWTIRGDSEKVAELLTRGADVNAKAEVSETPLHWACVMGHARLVSLLLEKGADVNAVSGNHCTPLILAALHGHEEIVKRLLVNGADPGIKSWPADAEGLAARKGHKNIVRLLEAHKPRPRALTKVTTGHKGPAETATIEQKPCDATVSPATLKWVFHTGRDYVSTPTIVGRTAHFISTASKDSRNDSCLHAVDMDTGQENWRFETKGRSVMGLKVVSNSAYFGSYGDQPRKHYAHAVDIKTRREKWKFEAEGQVYWISAVVNGVVYFGTFGGNVYAVDADTGREKWKYNTKKLGAGNQEHVSGIAVVDGTVCFGTGSMASDDQGDEFGYLVALDIVTGAEKWRFKLWKKASWPVVWEGTVYVGCDDGCLYAVDARTGLEKWRFSTRSESEKTARVIGVKIWDNVAYLTTLNGPAGFYTKDAHVFAIDLKSGRYKWKAKTDASFLGQISLIDGKVYVPGGHGDIYIFDSETGNLRSKFVYGADNEYGSIEGDTLFWSSKGGLYAMDIAAIPLSQDETESAPSPGETSPVAKDTKQQSREEMAEKPETGHGGPKRLNREQVKEHRRTGELFEGSHDLPRMTDTQESKQPAGLKWKIRVGVGFYSPIVVSQGLVFFFPVNSKLLAVDVNKGRQRWEVPNSWQPDLAVERGLVLFREGRRLYAVDIKTRQVKWKQDEWKQDEWTCGRILTADGMIVTETGDGYICGLDLETGKVRWKFVMGHRLHRPTVGDGMVFVVAAENIIYGLDLKTGTKQWEHKLQGDLRIFTAVSDGVVYFGSQEGDAFFCRAVDFKTKEEKWNFPCEDLSAAPAIGQSVVCFPSSDHLYGVDKTTGKLLWKFRTEGLWNTPVIAHGTAYFRDSEVMHALDVQAGQVKWQLRHGVDKTSGKLLRKVRNGGWWVVPSWADGRVYFRDSGVIHMDAQTGPPMLQLRHGSPKACPYEVAVVDGVVYFGSDDGYVYAVDAIAAE